MALALNDNHIIYYHMDEQCSICLSYTYFTGSGYLVVQCWVCATLFHPGMINPTEPMIYCYTKFFEGVMACTPLGFHCTRLVAVINYSNAALPFIATAFPAL